MGLKDPNSLHTVRRQCHALYQDEENPLQWYEAVIDSIVPPAQEWERPRYVVTFLEYGNTEEVTLGMVDFSPSKLETDEVRNGAAHGHK